MENWIKIMENSWPKEKLDEIYTVKIFLTNANKNFQFTKENIDIYPKEPADIFVKDINKKFQITWADHEFLKEAGKTKPGNLIDLPPRRRENVFREYVIRPLNKKGKYGKSAKGIICLIRAPFDPPWIEEDLKRLRITGSNRILSKWGFDKIFLVCSGRNIQIYP
ncbi:hypothetical protein AMJ49_01190 [Parcubacteria bacterium DG_74_2]|nr:MAG: hypothetical protein AMJ49_01190 [Parcubacteria bacterium DG_74_2]